MLRPRPGARGQARGCVATLERRGEASDPPAWLITAVVNEPWPSLPWHSWGRAVTRPWEEMRGQEAPVETVTAVTTAPTTPGTARTTPALALSIVPQNQLFSPKTRPRLRLVPVIVCGGGGVAGPSPALPAAGSECCSSSKCASSVVGKQLPPRERHRPGLGGDGGTGKCPQGREWSPGTGKEPGGRRWEPEQTPAFIYSHKKTPAPCGA